MIMKLVKTFLIMVLAVWTAFLLILAFKDITTNKTFKKIKKHIEDYGNSD